MRILQAGPCRMLYEDGFLRYLESGSSEILRRIYFALRDENWGTIPLVISNEQIRSDEHSFDISYDAENVEGGNTIFQWHVRITGTSDGQVNFVIDGNCLKKFRKNRAGFCVLHPLDGVRNAQVVITDTKDVRHTARFPDLIAAANPFKQIKKMEWTSAQGQHVLEFAGDVFETEDQRNWGDGSFKTFCTPLALPFPVDIDPGLKVHQSVRFSTHAVQEPKIREKVIDVRTNDHRGIFPSIGLHATRYFDASVTARIAELRPAYLHADVFPLQGSWVEDLSAQYQTAFQAGVLLHVSLFLTSNAVEELDAFVVLAQQNRVRLADISLLSVHEDVTPAHVVALIPRLREAFPNARVGIGTAFNFTEINKNPLPAMHADFITLAYHPQEHSFDDRSLFENIESLFDIGRSTKALYPSADVQLSPITLRKRFNPYTNNPDKRIMSDEDRVDPRQQHPLCGAWAAAALYFMVKGGVGCASFFTTQGAQGIMDEDSFPVYHTLAALAPFQRCSVSCMSSSEPREVLGMEIHNGPVMYRTLINLTETDKKINAAGNETTLRSYEVRIEKLNRAE